MCSGVCGSSKVLFWVAVLHPVGSIGTGSLSFIINDICFSFFCILLSTANSGKKLEMDREQNIVFLNNAFYKQTKIKIEYNIIIMIMIMPLCQKFHF